MEIRYLGFEQKQNCRTYKFDVREKGQPAAETTVTADMEIFRVHRVGIQEGPVLCGNKLTADLERGWAGEHELTSADVGAFATTRSLAEAHRAEMRKAPRQRPTPPKDYSRPPWGPRTD